MKSIDRLIAEHDIIERGLTVLSTTNLALPLVLAITDFLVLSLSSFMPICSLTKSLNY